MSAFLKRLFCNHRWELVDTIHGDEAMATRKRSHWRCKSCGKHHLDGRYPSEVTIKRFLEDSAHGSKQT